MSACLWFPTTVLPMHCRVLLSFLFLVSLFTTEVRAQLRGPDVPDSLSVQGLLTDTGGNPVADGSYDLTFKLYKGATMVWEEAHSNVPVEGGVFNVVLGGSTPLDKVGFGEPIDLGVTVETDSEIVPRTALSSTAFALGIRGMYAVDAENGSRTSRNLVGGAANNYVGPGVVGATISGGGGKLGSTVYADSVLSHWGTIGGGVENAADQFATVGGGQFNRAVGMWSAVAGGRSNRSRNQYASIAGGFGNIVAGDYGAIPGGATNAARGEGSFAAGINARANHDNTFAWNGNGIGGDTLGSTAAGQFLIQAPGGVGVGTNTPATSLHVATSDLGLGAANLGNDDIAIEGSDSVLGLYSTSGGNWGSAVSLAELTTVGELGVLVNKWAMARNTSGAGDHLRFTFGTDPDYAQNDTQMRIEPGGDVRADGSFIGGGADVAEAVDPAGRIQDYQPGDVLVVATSADRTFKLSNVPYATTVAGVYAAKPGLLLHNTGIDDDLSTKIPLTVVGIVPTKVTAENGPIRRGDMLVTSSTPGHAMKAERSRLEFGTVIGKALENFDGSGSGMIEVLVNVK